ncbi:M6 family metalloprotease domain-containing protein [Limisphaera sp. VF-2]|uniref:M6 family metalloprotease domain-containing protein n=1 Tax=Limisphaera sp. VF-2 TaxID=3400418 RepID=UPI003C28AB58
MGAAPFKGTFEFRQPDGTLIVVRGEGDEFYAHFETPDGYTVTFDPALRAYCYARVSPEGRLVSTGIPVHLARPAELGLEPGLRPDAAVIRTEAQERRRRWEEAMEIDVRWETLKALQRAAEAGGPEDAPPTAPTLGVKVGLCLLIDFPDEPATVPRSEIEAFCNADQYSGYGNNGSVKKYFQEVSNGLLIYSNVVTVYVRVPQPKSYYNDVTKDSGEQANELIRDAVAALRSLPNFQTEVLPMLQGLTVDNQNRVVACNVFYAGDNGGVWSMGLWPHAWTLVRVGAQELWPGGKKIWRYQISNIGQQLELGTFVHENGHLLCGFPDLYDYDYDSKGGAGVFCLMGYGSFGPNPVQVCAYLKRAAGWATVTDLTRTSALLATVTATPGPGFNHFYRYRKPGSSTEYFLIEARFQTNRDARLPASGVAIWHIDELGNRDDQRRDPNTRHQNFEVTLIQADNRWDLHRNVNAGDREDLYYAGNPASGYRNVFSDGSAPAARWWDGTSSGLLLQHFGQPAPTMEFVVGNPQLAPRVVVAPQPQVVREGTNVAFRVQAEGIEPLSYLWRKDGQPVAGATTSRLVLDPVRMEDAGLYSVAISNRFGGVTSPDAELVVLPAMSLAAALDAEELDWQTDGAFGWYGQHWTTSDGDDAAASGFLRDGEVSRLWTVLAGPGTLTFWWRVSSEPGRDQLQFLWNGTPQGVLSGEVDWSRVSLELPPGWQTVEWIYRKDGTGRAGEDRGWVDRVTFVERPMPPVIRSQPADQGVVRGFPVTLTVVAEGTPPLHYQWFREGGPIAGATASVLAFAEMSEREAGRYTVVVSNRYGTALTTPAAVTVTLTGTTGDHSLGQRSLPAGATEVVAVAAGLWHSVALRADGRVVAWGYNHHGQCEVPSGITNAVAVAAGGYHSLAVLADGTVVGWGANGSGQASPPSGLRGVVAVAAGHWHSLALTEEGRVVAWGDGSGGQLHIPTGLRDVVAIAAGARHSLALTRQGRVVAWGDNRNAFGQWVGQATVPAGLSDVVTVAAGAYHSLAVRADGRVVGWGDNSQGQLAFPSDLRGAAAASAGVEHSVILLRDGSAIALGNNWRGQCDLPAGQRMAWVAAGGYHTVYVLESVQVPRLVRYGRADTGFRLWVQGSPRWRYGLEYAERLNAPSWTALPAVRGQPGLVGLEDPGPLPSQRFYRVRQE